MISKWMEQRIKQKWNTYKRDRWLRSSRKKQDEFEYIFQRMRSICFNLGIPVSKLDVETMQRITSIAGKGYRARVGKASLCGSKTKRIAMQN